MIKSSKSRMQRLFRYNTSSLHQRQHFVHSHVEKSLREKMKISASIRISKGDTIKVVSGSKRGTTGKVIEVDLKSGKIFIDSISKKTAKGKEYHIPISPSNVYITDLNTSDKRRMARMRLSPDATMPSEKPSVAPVVTSKIGTSGS